MSYDDFAPSGGRPPQQRRSSGGDHTREAIESGKYTEVKVRLQKFYAAYPTGSIVTDAVIPIAKGEIDDIPRIMVRSLAYRTPDDPHPGVGTSWMSLPGTTPYTNNSEVENCETSSWGRAIAAVGIAIDENIATAQEIRMKRGGEIEAPSTVNASALRDAAAAAANEAPANAAPPASVPVEPVPVEPTPPVSTGTKRKASPSPESPPDAPEPVPEPEAAPDVTEAATIEAAAEAMGEGGEGVSYDEFKRLAREKFIPNGTIATVARNMVEAGRLRQVGAVKELTDHERLILLDECIRLSEEAQK